MYRLSFIIIPPTSPRTPAKFYDDTNTDNVQEPPPIRFHPQDPPSRIFIVRLTDCSVDRRRRLQKSSFFRVDSARRFRRPASHLDSASFPAVSRGTASRSFLLSISLLLDGRRVSPADCLLHGAAMN